MRKTTLYSRSQRNRPDPSAGSGTPVSAAGGASGTEKSSAQQAGPASSLVSKLRLTWRQRFKRHERVAFALGGALFAVALVGLHATLSPPPQKLTQRNIDEAVLHTLKNVDIPSMAATAFDAIAPSVVAVRSFVVDKEEGKNKAGTKDDEEQGGFKGRGKTPPANEPATPPLLQPPRGGDNSANKGADGRGGNNGDKPANSAAKGERDFDEPDPGYKRRGIGSGVVVKEDGTILTNLHVVGGADKIRVEFYDGTVSDAVVIGARPEHDLAVLKANRLPDDLKPATMRSTSDLRPGDEVVAVGFPFGIGPSVSAGVISGLRREYLTPEGKVLLTNLIQFDAAANPGNSGGPLVTKDGEVVGIVTAILNPSEQRVFIGIGFAVPIENAAAAIGTLPF